MPLNLENTGLVVQFALLTAGEEDQQYERQLGPIHLLKYVYLADLAYAQRNGGKTFSGADWRFHKFGPWSNAVFEVIDPVLRSIGAERREFRSDYGDDDWVRYSMRDEKLLAEKQRGLPAQITLALRRDIRRFHGDTPTLLDHVYKTEPMLAAAPSERLDFSIASQPHDGRAEESQKLRFDELSAKKKKRLKERLRSLRNQQGVKPSASRALLGSPRSSRYDDVFEEGVAWLDELAGPTLVEGDFTAEFSGDVWGSPTRKGGDVP